MPRPSGIELLSPELRAQLHQLLDTPGVTHQQVADKLNEAAGEQVTSKSAVHRYANRMREVMERSRQAREMATTILEHCGPEGEQRFSEVIVHQLRTVVFDLLVKINSLRSGEGLDSDEQLEQLARIAELVAKASRSVREAETAADRSAERRRKMQADLMAETDKLQRQAQQGRGLSDEAWQAFRNRLIRATS